MKRIQLAVAFAGLSLATGASFFAAGLVARGSSADTTAPVAVTGEPSTTRPTAAPATPPARHDDALEGARPADDCKTATRTSPGLEAHARYESLRVATCYEAKGRLVDALVAARAALQEGVEHDDAALTRDAAGYVREIAPRIPKVAFRAPTNVEGLRVTFDGREVRGRLSEEFAVNAGSHTVTAEAIARGARVAEEQRITAEEGRTVVVRLALEPSAFRVASLQRVRAPHGSSAQRARAGRLF